MGVEGQEKRDEQVVRVPEGLVGLLPDPMVSGCIHQEHAEEHHMPRNTADLSIVDLHSRIRS